MPQMYIENRFRVIAIVVTFSPDIGSLQLLLSSIANQVEKIIVIDNGSPNVDEIKALPLFCKLVAQGGAEELLPLEKNMGLAAAQNIGIEQALAIGASHVLLLDQDSQPDPRMVEELLTAYSELAGRGIGIGALGPRYVDERQTNPPPFIRVIGLRLVRYLCEANCAPIEVDYLIASGSLISAETLNVVGSMRGDFFIDYIDIEWGLRARRNGFLSFGICSAKMKHSLGDAPYKWRGRSIPMHSATRHYYHFRNAVSLYKDPLIPVNWKWVDGSKLLLKLGFYSFYARPRFDHVKLMLVGILDGLRGKSGPLER
jgi:rhamnosyltransferase